MPRDYKIDSIDIAFLVGVYFGICMMEQAIFRNTVVKFFFF